MLPKHDIQERKRQRYIETKTDRISELPDEILSRIISDFTVRDAVNASVLSSTWRHLCASSVSSLKFDWKTMFPTRKSSSIWQSGNPDPCPQYKDLFVRGLNQFLQFYEGTHLVLFRVAFCLGRDSTCEIDRWVSFAVSMGVEQLHLKLSCAKFRLSDDRDRGNKLYIFHPVLLSHGEVSKLKLLYLHSCLLGPDLTDQFSSLKVLKLVNVPLGPPQVQSILSCCFNLEYMTLRECSLPVKLCISSSHLRLKSLDILDCFGMKRIELFSTSLVNFKCLGVLVKFFLYIPNLQILSLGAKNKSGVRYIFSQLASDLPLVKTLSIMSLINWVYVPEHITAFNKVEQLNLGSLREMKFDIQKMIAIIRACPLLQKFHLVTRCPVNYEQGGMEEVPTECVHKHLKEVEIGGFCGTWNQIEFAIYLLKYAIALERMVIDPRLNVYTGSPLWSSKKTVSWNEGEREKVCEQLQDYSKTAVVIIR